jgi:hypothetical protein
LKNNYSVGVLVYNPYDDENHLMRIQSCLNSLFEAANNYSGGKVFFHVVLNMSPPLNSNNIVGVGKITRNFVYGLKDGFPNISIEEYSYRASMMVKGYKKLVDCCLKDDSEYVSIFADDYVVPNNWFDIIDAEILEHAPDYLTPSTTFVAQTNLLVPIKWECFPKLDYVFSGDDKIGVRAGIDSGIVEKMGLSFRKFKTIPFVGPVCFETTVYKKCVLQSVAICTDYYSIFYNIDLFIRIKAANFRGVLSRKSFVFHYGKGATSAVYLAGDEKFDSSPAYKFLIGDIELFNKRNGANIKKWWSGNKPRRNKEYGYYEIHLVILLCNLKSFIKRGVLYGKKLLGLFLQ